MFLLASPEDWLILATPFAPQNSFCFLSHQFLCPVTTAVKASTPGGNA